MSLIAEAFPILLPQKELVTYVSKRICFKTPLVSQRINGSKRLLKSTRQ